MLAYFTFIILILTACGPSIPEWYVKPVPPSDLTSAFIGKGEGVSIQEAATRGIAQICETIKTNIESEFTAIESEHKSNEEVISKHSITDTVKSKTFCQFEELTIDTKEQSHADGKYYSLMVLPKDRYRKYLQSKQVTITINGDFEVGKELENRIAQILWEKGYIPINRTNAPYVAKLDLQIETPKTSANNGNTQMVQDLFVLKAKPVFQLIRNNDGSIVFSENYGNMNGRGFAMNSALQNLVKALLDKM